MGSRRAPLQHPLAQPFQRAAESLTTALGESSVAEYHGTVHLFLTYLGTHHPQVRSLEQLRRAPHIRGWLSQLRSHMPPLAKFTLAARIVRLRRLLEELAWTQQLPALAHLLGCHKSIEVRSKATHLRERVYIYASKSRINTEEESRIAAQFGIDVDALPRVVLI